MLESIGDGFLILDRDWRLVYLNPVAASFVGVNAAEHIGRNLWEQFPQLVGTDVEDHFRKAMQERSPQVFETFSNVTGLWHHHRVLPCDEGISVYFQDISARIEHAHAEEELARANAKLSELLNSVQQDFFGIDRDWNFVFASRHWASRVGVESTDLIGRNIWETFPKFRGTAYEEAVRAAMNKAETLSFIWEGLYTDAVYALTVSPSADGVTVLGIDITENRRMEEALRKSEEEYRHLVEHAPTAIYEVDFVSRRFKNVNDAMCHTSGYSREELMQMDPMELLDQDGRLLFRERMRKALAGEAVDENVTYRVVAKDGREIQTELNVRPVFKDGMVTGALVVGHDVTQRVEVEEALRESREKYRALTETNIDFIWEVDAQGRYTYCSPQMKTLWGIDPESMLGRSPFDLVPPEFIEQARESFAGVAGSGQSFHGMECTSCNALGQLIQLEISGVPFVAEDGRLLGYRGTTRDVTARRKAQDALKESEKRYRDLHENLRDAFVQVDMDGRITVFNDILRQMLGYSTEEIGRLTYNDITPERWHDFEDEIIRTQVLARGYSDVYQKEYRRKDGIVFPVELRTILVRDSEGSPSSMWATIRDITERKEAEDALRQSEGRFRSVLDNSTDVIYRVNLQSGRYEYISPACEAIVGYTPDELMAMEVDESLAMVHPDDLAGMRAGLRMSEETGKGELIYRQRSKNGEYRWIANRMSIIRDDSGRPLYRDGNIRDISERKKAEEALRRSQEEVRILLENTPAGLVLFDARHPYRVLAHNRYYQELFAEPFRSQGMAGLNIFEYAPAAEAEGIIAVLDEVVRTKEPKSFVDFPFRSDSSRQAWFNWHISPLVLDGQVVALVSMSLDVTDRKQAEDALAESHRQVQSIIDNTPAIVYALDLEERFIMANAALGEVLNTTPDEMIGKRRNELMPEEDAEQHEADDRQVIETGSAMEFEEHSELPGRSITWLTTKFPLRDAQGRICAVGGISADISERKQLERRQQEVLERERHIAQTLQKALLPPTLPRSLHGYRIASVYEFAAADAEVGGDFYDIMDLGDGRLGVLIGDVMGKGLHAAISVAAARHSIRSYAYSHRSPGEVLTLANDALCRFASAETNMLTAFYAVVDTSSNVVTYSNAAHEPPVIRRADGTVEEMTGAASAPLAIMDGVRYPDSICELHYGDVVVLATDGITEARNEAVEIFGKERFIHYIESGKYFSIEEMAGGLLAVAKAHAAYKLQDDAAILVFGPQDDAVEPGEEGPSEDVPEFGQDSIVVSGSGGLTNSTSEDFHARLKRAKLSPDAVTVDLRDASFVDTSILNTLADAARTMLADGRRLRILAAEGSYPLHVLELVQFRQLMDIETGPAGARTDEWTPLEEQTLTLHNRARDLDKCRRAAFNVAMTMGFSVPESWDITSAFVEACSNALEHGSKTRRRTVRVTVRALPDRFEAVVKDHGGGFVCPDETPMPPPTSPRGRGIPIMRLHMDEVEFNSSDGCEVMMVKYISGRTTSGGG